MTNDKLLQMEIIEKTGLRTVPQIFIDDKHIGGFSELRDLEASGDLDVIISEVD